MTTETPERAVLIALGSTGFEDGKASPLTTLVDRPFMQHVIESLVDRGIKSFDILLHHDADRIESYFEDGTRWGATFRYHLLHDVRDVYARIRRFGDDGDRSTFLLWHVDRLQCEGVMENHPAVESDAPTVFFHETSESSSSENAATSGTDIETSPVDVAGVSPGQDSWNGAAWVTNDHLDAIGTAYDGFEDRLMAAARKAGLAVCTPEPLDGRTLAGIVVSQKRVLNREFPELIRFSGGADEGIWIQRNVALHRDVRLVPPVFVGPHCEIEERVVLGPNAVISSGCHVHAKCEVTESLIGENSMLGEGLTIDQCVIDRHKLYHLRHNVAVAIHDDLLIGSTQVILPGVRQILRCCARIAAAVVLGFVWPILLGVALIQRIRCGKAFFTEEVVRLPVPEGNGSRTFRRWRIASVHRRKASNLRHFLLEFLPGLINVVRGEMGWVGVTPITPENMELMPPDWRRTYEDCDGGLVSGATVLHGDRDLNEEVMSAQIYHAVTVDSFWARLKTILGYLQTFITGPASHATRAMRLPAQSGGAMVR